MTRATTDSDPIESSDELPETVRESTVTVRPGAQADVQLARTLGSGPLFGEQPTVGTFGRFRVLERLGAGGMGVVYEAYDPDLARGVALKLVNVAAKDRDTALAEAKALARLSHPNVVPIYDVGLERDHVYLVMELVRGKTLRQWAEGRTLGEILMVYQQAGVALAAAHDVGLVHRDFKPDNAVVGTDGRVRVVDFGLACQADDPERATSEPRRVAGTPRFMAPEIKAGAAITPAADQYSFCVALADAFELARQTPPRRIAAALDRGRTPDPAERFASMDDLLRALARDPARTWRRGAAGGLVLSIGTIAFFAGRHNPSEVPDPCGDGAARLEAAWSPAARSTALERLVSLGPYGQSLRPRLERDLEAHASHWVSEYRAACQDRRRGTETDTMSDRRTICLRRGSDALAAVGELIGHVEPANLAAVPLAVQSMPSPAACSDLGALTSDIALPSALLAPQVSRIRRQITQATILVGAGRYEQALTDARTAVADARTAGYEPALAEALLVQGHAETKLAGREAAIPALVEATTAAMSSHADALAVEAWARRAWAQGTSTDPEAALGGLEVIEALARRTTSATFERALLYNNLGSVELGRDHIAKAREYFERARLESRNVAGGGALELVAIRINLAFVTEDRSSADKLLAEAAAELIDRLGPTHPDALQAEWLRGSVTIEDLRTADELLTPVCRAYALHPTLADRMAQCWTEVGLVRWDQGDRVRALEAMERAVQGQNDPREAAAYVALLQGNARAAARQFADAIAALPPDPTEPAWNRLGRAALMLGEGRALRETGDLRGARVALDGTIAIFEPIVRAQPVTRYERRLGRARVERAFTLAALGASSSERSAAAAEALTWLRRVGGQPTEMAKLLGGGGVP